MPNLTLRQRLVNVLTATERTVSGESMTPALRSGQRVVVWAARHPWNTLRRGDIVVFRDPLGGQGCYIKRVIGLPDEYIELKDGRVHVNEAPLVEPWLAGRAAAPPLAGHPASRWLTGPDEYFALGDNRQDSLDSRRLGPIPQSALLGRVCFRYWPLRAWGRLGGGEDAG